MVCTLIDHRNEIRMVKTQEEPRAEGRPRKIVAEFFFFFSIFTITFTLFLRSISVKVSRKVERARVFFIFTITFTLLVGQFPLKFLGKSNVHEFFF